MDESIIYRMQPLEEYNDKATPTTFIFSANAESRAEKGFDYLYRNDFSIKHILLIRYAGDDIPNTIDEKLNHYNVTQIVVKENPIEFVIDIKNLRKDLWDNKVVFDISCVKIPEMFSIIKYLKMVVPLIQLHAIYSIPYDYNFPKEPFTSYKSFAGDLTMYELLGFSGAGNDTSENSDLFLFMGFEGALALKVTEDTAYKELNLINNLPSFYQKYKDISVINNYQLMQSQNHILYTPADNPFETYNLLNSVIGLDAPACISPLSTKPIALGVCLFALDHEKVRVVYPVSQKYNKSNTVETYRTYIYDIHL